MKRVNEIRQHLQSIPGAFAEFDPEETYRGSQAAIKVLWDPLQEEDKESGALSPGISEELDGEGGESAQVEELFELGAEIDSDLLHGAMNGADGERIRKAVLAKGVDALGWYGPFHAKGVQWGIYVPASGLAYLIANVFAALPVDLPTRLLNCLSSYSSV